MKALIYKFTITNGKEQSVLRIVAHNAIEAICIGLRTSLYVSSPVKISCKPIERIAP